MSPSTPVSTEPGFRQLSEETVHRGAVISTAVARFAAPDGTVFERDVVRHPGAVSVVPLVRSADGAEEVVLVRQYRAAVDGWLLEIPAGKRDVPDEPPEETAERELVEEVGLRPRTLVQLAEFQNSPGFCDEHSWVFLAEDPVPAEASAHSLEEQYLTVERVPLAAVQGMIEAGAITDAKTIIGLTLTLLRSR